MREVSVLPCTRSGKFSRVVYFHQPIAGDLKDTQICDLSSLFSIGSVVMSEGSQIYFPAYPFHTWIPLIYCIYITYPNVLKFLYNKQDKIPTFVDYGSRSIF
ncbi:hypothetical protein CDL12_23473 [Handroanthus impetiginosus]|uniref:Uncharacterized protein n=1 Tax=Handroanthus impetiginosus TaxID=429701 RepID=A0A2G9GFD5_9LAMI|nr:hypothetical protein CDL12_23473 [Handroanthus impetiginosus]